MDLADKLVELFEAEGIDYNFVVVNKLASFIEDLSDTGVLATSDLDEAQNIEFEVR